MKQDECNNLLYTVKPVNKGHPRERRKNIVFIDKWSLFGGNFVYFNKKGLLKCGLYLQDGLYSEVAFNTVCPLFESGFITNV